jgi:deoxycytidine triphosphate deaminase/addiction module HigA family antidote
MSAGSQGKAKAIGETGHIEPGAHLRAELLRLGLDQVAVSKATGVSRQSVNNIINGRQSISRAMAGKLGRLTGHSSDYWLSSSFAGPRQSRKDAAAPQRFVGASLLVNHQIARAVKDGIVVIEPFIMPNLHAASIDLTLASSVTIANGNRVGITAGKNFMLRPGDAVRAATAERVELPNDYLGRVGGNTRLWNCGIMTASAFQLEPGFKGPLNFWLFNASGLPFRLQARDTVLSLEIVRLGVMPDKVVMR